MNLPISNAEKHGFASVRCLRAGISAFALILAGTAVAQAATLTVRVDGVAVAKGTVVVELDNSTAGWDNKAKPVASAHIDPIAGEVTYVFKDLPPGAYAVGVIDDENGNGELDTNFLGIPTEGFGFSNNLHLMRKPSFDEAHFDLRDQDLAIVIHLMRL